MGTRLAGFKRIRHYDETGHAHFLTFSCLNKEPLLVSDAIRNLFLSHLDKTRLLHKYLIWAYVLMPNHVHLLAKPTIGAPEIAKFLHALKGPTGFYAKKLLARDGVLMPRFWQSGPGFDENITDLDRARKVIEYIHQNPVRKELVKSITEWKWSSARFWAGLDTSGVVMDAIT